MNYLWASAAPEDRTILFPLGHFLAENANELALLRATGSPGARPPPGSRQDNPVSATLLLFRPEMQFPGLNRLLLVLATAAIEVGSSVPDKQRRRIAGLAGIIRGALEDRDSPLRLILGDSPSLPRMILSVDTQFRDGGDRLHQTFGAAWRQWIRDTLIRWIRADPIQLSAALRPHALLLDIEAPSQEVGGGADPDDQSVVQCDVSEPASEGEPEDSPRIRKCKAIANGMVRASGGDLYSPVDQIAPSELITTLAKAAMQAAKAAVATGHSVEAEGPAALALALATGIRELDLELVVWGTKASDKTIAIDPNHPWLYRCICMPPYAVKPPSTLNGWLEEPAEQLAWPLPPGLHHVLRQISPSGAPTVGTAVLPRRSMPAADRYHLWGISQRLAPEIGLAPSQVRLALAAELTQRFGSEIAQLVLGDTFSLSAAPAHYSAQPGGEVVAAVTAIQQRWFGETVQSAPGASQTLGSKLVLTDEAARRWPAQLRQQMRSASHQRKGSEIAQWRAHRDHLVGALCAVTGARPHSWLGEIDLDQVVPEFAVIVITDKASDMLRMTRIAATGRRWLADLRIFLDRLCQLADGAPDTEAARHAVRILRSDAPLFSMPDGEGGPLTVAEFRCTMPEPLRDTPNHYRHRLNACLQREHVDAELRHAQLGWVVTPAHALADLSPWSAKAFGDVMAPVLDEIMVRDGWYPPTQRTPRWSWDGVPERPLKDWASVAQAHASKHDENVRRLKAKLVERWKEVSGDVCERLAQAVAEYFPSLRINIETRRLELASDLQKAPAVEMSQAHYGLLCDRVRQGDKEPNDATEGIAARILLFRIILAARRRGLVQGPLPSRPILSVTSNPSPFLPGLGLAVRHAEALRYRLLERASKGRAHDQGPLATTSVLAYSAYRDLPLATAAVAAAAKGVRSHARVDCIRIPAVVDRALVPMAFGGLPALVLARRSHDAPTARAPDHGQAAAWWRQALALPMPIPEADTELLRHVELLFQAAGRLELSGPERTVMLGDSSLAAVPVERSVARDDKWPLRTAEPTGADDRSAREPTYEDEPSPPRAGSKASDSRDTAKGYARLVGALDPETFPKLTGGKSDSHHGWRGKLETHLAKLQREFGEHTNLGLLIGYTRHRLRYGGRRKPHLQHATLGWLRRFASDLLAIAGQQSILEWETDEFRARYMAVLVGKPVTARRQAFDALMPFHQYLVEVHQMPEIPLAELAAFAGVRVTFVDPGMLTGREVEGVLAELHADLTAEAAREDRTPEAMRLLELREIMFLILEGSGIRPASAFGLTLGDVVLLGLGRDFVRVRTSGGYGRAKSTASLGFVPLEGSTWEKSRTRLVAWVEQEKRSLSDTPWWNAPLFAVKAGEKRRFSRSYLTRRIDQLLKWVSANRKAHTYWLRKNRISARHEQVADLLQPMARDTYAAMCISGHTLIQTPMQHYISDPAIAFSGQLREGRSATRADILAVTNLDAPSLDMAWLRAGAARSPQRLGIVFTRLNSVPAPAPAEHLTEPPPLKHRQTISPRHIDGYARALHQYRDRHEALLHSGLSGRQADAMDRLASEYVSRKGLAPWPLAQLRQKRIVLKPPRHLSGTKKLFAFLSAPPDADTKLLAEIFVEQAHIERLHHSDVLMVLTTAHQVDAARRFLATTNLALGIDVSADSNVLTTRGGGDRGMSHAAAFRWVMAIVWIFTKLQMK
ncbi:hypothetical protein [Dyella solisilvae]|uniref:hypothetical protein n=1 Tax=Dyella solisilvae TaxID=1920168 RepID=UPI0011C04D6D|nr:hypothetical protein [Dyella solisilvae]